MRDRALRKELGPLDAVQPSISGEMNRGLHYGLNTYPRSFKGFIRLGDVAYISTLIQGVNIVLSSECVFMSLTAELSMQGLI